MDEKKQGGSGADERKRIQGGYSAMPEEIPPGVSVLEPGDTGHRAASAPIVEPLDVDIRTHSTGTVMVEPASSGSAPMEAAPPEGPSAPKGDGATARRAVDRVMETAQHGAEKAREVARQRAEQGKEKVAERIEEMSSKLEEQISDKAEEYVSTVTGLATRYMERTAELLRGKSTAELVQLARDQIRERPLIVAAGAFAVGFIGARFLKS